MKILAVTDVHGAYSIVEDLIDRERPDIFILGGDIFLNAMELAREDVIMRFKRKAGSLFAIAGNMDDRSDDDLLSEAGISLNGKGVMKKGIGFFGVSGSPVSRLKTNYEISEEEIYIRLERGYDEIRDSRRKILVSHAPPHGTKVDIIHSGLHVGSHSVRKFILERQPDLVICGHIHEARGTDKIGETVIVNCGSAVEGYYATILDRDGKFVVAGEKST